MLQIGSKYKIARRLGPVFEKTQSQKFALRQQRKAQSAKRGRRPTQSEYNKQLLEKQKLRYTYGLKEKQLANYVKQALSSKEDTSAALYQLLERRLDSVIYRMGLAETRRMARQMASHGHITYNGRKVTIPSIQVRKSDVLAVREGSQSNAIFEDIAAKRKDFKQPSWMNMDWKNMASTITDLPSTSIYDFDFKRIIEFYTR